MEQIIKENALPEAATPEQSKQVKPLYTDLSISARIMQVLIPTLEIIRITGNSERRFSYEISDSSLSVDEYEAHEGHYKHKTEWIHIFYDTCLHKFEDVVDQLDAAIDTMTDLLGSIRKELGYEE